MTYPKSILKSEGIKSSAIVTIGNLFGTAVSAIALIIISRHLGPTGFGIFSAAFSLMMIIVRLGDFGLNLALQRHLARSDKPLENKSISNIFNIKMHLSIAITITAILLSGLLDTHILHFNNRSLIILAILSSLGVSLYEYVGVIAQSAHKFLYFAFSVIFQATGKIIAAITLVLSSLLDPLSAIALYGLAPLASGAIIARLSGIKLQPGLSLTTSLKQSIDILKVAKWTSIAVISAAVADNLDVLIIQSYLTSFDTGIFSAALRISTFFSLVGISVGSVLNIRVAKYRDRENLDKYIKKSLKYSLVVSILILALVPLSPLMIMLTAGPDYILASSSLKLLFVATAILAATSPYVALFFVFDKPEYFALSGIISTTTLLLSDIILIPSMGTIGASYARIVTRVCVLLFTVLYAHRSYKKHFSALS